MDYAAPAALPTVPEAAGVMAELEDDPGRGVLAHPRHRALGRRHTILLVAVACVAVGPEGGVWAVLVGLA